MNTSRQRLLQCLMILAFIILTGCCKPPEKKPPTVQDYINALMAQGVQVIKTGETYSIIIFNDTIFNTDSSNFSANSNRVLEPLTGLLKFYETVSIRISGFSDNSSTVRRGIALSGRQAERLGDYLAEQGLDARMIYAVGYGPALPVASNATPEGRAKNRRMVIKFRYIVIPVERYDY